MHHHRRKSGNTSMTDVRKSASVRPTTMTRRTTPQSVQKLGKSPRDREREWEEERWWDEERESFPQYCMYCEKQFVPADDRFLYCSESCRVHDQTTAGAPAVIPSRHHATHHHALYSEPRDIIPRASPSRPSSMHFSPPTSPNLASHHTSAISALKSLSIRPPSPSSPIGSYHPNIWPFGRSAAAASPSTSYSKPASGFFSSTYDSAYYGAGYSDRPLPSRRPGVYSRPKSIELVTPMVGR